MAYSEEKWRLVYKYFFDQSVDNYSSITLQSKESVSFIKSYVNQYLIPVFKNVNAKILDIGCATGDITTLFKKASNHVVGIDFFKPFIEEANKKHSGVFFLPYDVRNLSKMDESFDLIVAFGVFQHFKSTKEILEQIRAVYKQGKNSRIVILTLNSYFFGDLLVYPFRWLFKEKDYKYPKIFRRGGSDFETACKELGLKIVKKDYPLILPKQLQFCSNLFRFLIPRRFRNHILVELN